jgi:hypothetical protein
MPSARFVCALVSGKIFGFPVAGHGGFLTAKFAEFLIWLK